jgi:hypothetical protein
MGNHSVADAVCEVVRVGLCLSHFFSNPQGIALDSNMEQKRVMSSSGFATLGDSLLL